MDSLALAGEKKNWTRRCIEDRLHFATFLHIFLGLVLRMLPDGPNAPLENSWSTGWDAGSAHDKDGYVKSMVSPLRRRAAVANWSFGALVAVIIGLLPFSTALALSLFATQKVTVQFATADGRPMTNAEVRVFAPGDPKTPVEAGHADSAGKFVFRTDRDGLWSAQALANGEVARVTVRVGGPAQQGQREWVSPTVVIGGLLVLLALAVPYRVLRLRNQRRQR